MIYLDQTKMVNNLFKSNNCSFKIINLIHSKLIYIFSFLLNHLLSFYFPLWSYILEVIWSLEFFFTFGLLSLTVSKLQN